MLVFSKPDLMDVLGMVIPMAYLLVVAFMFRWSWLRIRKSALQRNVALGLMAFYTLVTAFAFRADFILLISFWIFWLVWFVGFPVFICIYCAINGERNKRNS
jgi:hypothetical protein